MTDFHDEKNSRAALGVTPADAQGKPRLPEVEQAEVIHYAYDPQTFEILCRPGQRLSEKKAQRLQELNLYAQVVRFAESHSP